MNSLLELLLSNLAMVAILAFLAATVQRWGRRPALAHGLWLLVLIKLITPPLVRMPVLSPATASEQEAAIIVEQAVAPRWVHQGLLEPVLPEVAQAPQMEFQPPVPPVALLKNHANPAIQLPEAPPGAAPVHFQFPVGQLHFPEGEGATTTIAWKDWGPRLLLGLWLAGAFAWFVAAGRRLWRFHRLLQSGDAAPRHVQELARDIATRLEVRCPQVWLAPGQISPLLWTFGSRPRLVVPLGLLDRLELEQWGTLLAHELAHWKRRDHWVRWLELIVLGLYWWCPLAWWACRGLHQAEEECCDAWVVWILPRAARAYALALVETVDFLAGARACLPPATSGLGHVRHLQRRLTMILRDRAPRTLTLGGLALLLAVAAFLLPLVPGRAQDPAVGDDPKPKKEPPPPPKDPPPPGKVDQEELAKIREEMRKLQEDFQKKNRELMERMMKVMGRPGIGVFPPMIDPLQPPPFPIVPPDIKLPDFKFPDIRPPVGFPAFPGIGGDVEKRLSEMERKLDMLMKELLKGRGDKAPVPKDAPIPKDEPKSEQSQRQPVADPPAPRLQRVDLLPAPQRDQR